VLHTALAAQQSIAVRAVGILAIVVVTGIYLWVREQRGKRRRS
jgi:hypothetical protein